MEAKEDVPKQATTAVERMEMAAGVARLICLMQIIEQQTRTAIDEFKRDGVHQFAIEATEELADYIRDERQKMAAQFVERVRQE